MRKSQISRRKALQIGTAAAALPLVHIRTAGAAGKLSVGFWDHWVPTGNAIMKQQVQVWADKNKVEVQSDFLGTALLTTAAAEQQAKTGHDIFALPTWEVHNHRDALEPVDDVVKRLADKYGQPNRVAEYLGKVDGHWLAIPGSSGTQNKGPCGRISLLKEMAGLDVLAMYPAKDEHTALADQWTYDAHVKAAEACHKAGKPFGIGLGQTSDSVDTMGTIFAGFGAELVDAKGNITVDSDNVKQALEYALRLAKVLPADTVSYDDASNNRALISGQSALIWNPPSAWAVARRDAPDVAKDCWTFPPPAGPKGRFTPYLPYYWGIWNFGKNISAAKELCEFLMDRPQVQARCTEVLGYDLPPFDSMLDFTIWADAEPPKGSVYNYPLRPSQKTQANIAALPAPPDIAVQIYNRGTQTTMVAKLLSGQKMADVISWAKNELEGFAR